MHITLLTIGKSKDSFFQAAEEHFLKLLRPYCTCKVQIIKDEPLRGPQARQEILQKETIRLEKALCTDYRTIVLDAKGKTFTSEQFAQWLGREKDAGHKLQFILGGPYGLDTRIKESADEIVSLSSLTLPHQLAKLVFLEQLYRAWTILSEKQYHY